MTQNVSYDIGPFADVCWLWPEGCMYLTNCYAQFRHDFELKEIPEQAPLFITADQHYRLYVNGNYVCRGPARGYQSHWPYDEVELVNYLRRGHNWISVEAYNPGIGTFQYIHHSNAGMICAAVWGELKIATGRDTWIMRRAPGNNPEVARLAYQIAFQEDFNAAADDGSWITSPVPPVWPVEERFRWRGVTVAGAPPWTAVEPRGIPLLREEVTAPEAVVSNGTGKMAPGWQNCFNIAWHWSKKELPSVCEWLPGASVQAKKLETALELIAEPVGQGGFRAVTLDLGRIMFGSLILELKNTDGGEVVDCYYHQSLTRGIPENLLSSKNPGFIALATRLRAAKESCRREFFPLMGCRQVTLILRNLQQPVTVRVSWRTAEYPFAMHGVFDYGDAELNEIVRICRNTQQICAADAYMDTPWREQGQWWGDARIQARNTFYLDGDARLLARGIRSIAGQDSPYGLTPGVAPCSHEECVLPDFSLTWILTIYDHYFQTGSLDLFFEFHDRIKAILQYFESMEDAQGLVRTDPRFWLFEDWAALPKTGTPTFLNLWRLYTLEHYAKLLRAVGLDSTVTDQNIVRLRQIITAHCLNPHTGLLEALPDHSYPPSVHDQALAVLLNLAPQCHSEMTAKRILPFLRGEKIDGATPSSFWCSYLFEAAQKLGLGPEVLAFIRRHWSKMIASGGTWECLEWDEQGCQSCCHAWSSHPVWHIANIFLGLEQLTPGWQSARITPAYDFLPRSGRIVLPLPVGDLKFEWHDKKIIAEIPQSMTLYCNETMIKGKISL